MDFSTAFTRLFGCRYPLQQAGMGGFTNPDLAVAVSDAGGFGMLSGTVAGDALAAQLDVLPAGAAVGVNFLVPFLDRRALEEAAGRSPARRVLLGRPRCGAGRHRARRRRSRRLAGRLGRRGPGRPGRRL